MNTAAYDFFKKFGSSMNLSSMIRYSMRLVEAAQ